MVLPLLAGAAIGAVGSFFGGKEKARRAKNAGIMANQQLAEGRNYLNNESGLSAYRDAGRQASTMQQGLLGTGGDPVAAQNALNKYLDSSGYKFQLTEGTNALNANAALSGKLDSGATVKATQRYGQGSAGNYLNQYLDRLSGISQQGQSAANTLAQGNLGVAGDVAGNTYTSRTAAGDAMAEGYQGIGQAAGFATGYGNLFGGLSPHDAASGASKSGQSGGKFVNALRTLTTPRAKLGQGRYILRSGVPGGPNPQNALFNLFKKG